MSAAFVDALIQYRRATTAAGALWRAGLVPECHAYMASALRSMLAPWRPAEPADGPAGEESLALSALERAGYRDLDRLRAALAATAGITSESSGMTASVPPDFEWIWAEAERLSRASRQRFTPPQVRQRARRRALVAFGVFLAGTSLCLARLWGRPRVTASASYSLEYSAAHATDGFESSEWLLPEKTPGWLDITFPSPRSIESVLVVNGHNRTYRDRAARQVRVTAFSEDGPVASAEKQFAGITGNRSVLDFAVPARGVTHLRIDVLSFFGHGSSLAEVEVH